MGNIIRQSKNWLETLKLKCQKNKTTQTLGKQPVRIFLSQRYLLHECRISTSNNQEKIICIFLNKRFYMPQELVLHCSWVQCVYPRPAASDKIWLICWIIWRLHHGRNISCFHIIPLYTSRRYRMAVICI